MSRLDDQSLFQRAAEAIRSADALLIGTGAGMGVDSGLPDFRGNQGFWKAYPPLKERGLSFVEMANPDWFHRDPQQAWGFYGHRWNLYQRTDPHAGFEIMHRWGRSKPSGYFVFTSNIDAHFQRAGFDPLRIVECHGSLNHRQCVQSCTKDIWEGDGQRIEVDEVNFRAAEPLPACPCCGRLARPNVLMFGDGEWLPERTETQWERYVDWLEGLAGERLVVVECGAGTAVPTVRYECQRRGGRLIRINPRDSSVSPGQIPLACGALEALQRIDAVLRDV